MKGEAHNTPHFHAKYGSEEASIAIENLKILAGTINDRAYDNSLLKIYDTKRNSRS